MIELINNCTHFSEHATYLVTNKDGERKIIKASTSKNGIKALHSEVLGWNWYQKLRSTNATEPICQVIQEKDSYFQVQIAYIDGYMPDYFDGLERNAKYIRSVIRHYCDIWPHSSALVPMHGDFSLGNVIINADGVYIIDWEHFIADAVPWGFDAIYLLFETLYLSMSSRLAPSVGEVTIICEQINVLNECCKLHVDMVRNPLRFLKKYFEKNNHLWGEQFVKFPILSFTNDQITKIDNMVLSRSKGC